MSREVVIPDRPVYFQARDAHRGYLGAKERGEPTATVERLRMIYEAQMKAATDYHLHGGAPRLQCSDVRQCVPLASECPPAAPASTILFFHTVLAIKLLTKLPYPKDWIAELGDRVELINDPDARAATRPLTNAWTSLRLRVNW